MTPPDGGSGTGDEPPVDTAAREAYLAGLMAAEKETDSERNYKEFIQGMAKNTESPNGRPAAVKQRHNAMDLAETTLAALFVDIHASDLRFVNGWGRWMEWDGARWKPESTLLAFDYARAIIEHQAALCPSPDRAANVTSASTVAAVERLARANRKLAATVDQWDSDPMMLACPSVTVDLETGDEYDPLPESYCTKICAVDPDSNMDLPLWNSFLDRVTGGNIALQLYLQRVAGYCLTGLTREQVLFFFYGTGANGKSVFIETLRGIVADYGTSAPMETFTETRSDRHPTELAGLRGARLVTAVETQSGRHWNESRIKALTGGDTITARFMRQDFFEFTPAFKLVIAGNHKPALRNVDEAIRRRIHLVPFTVTIPPEERDKDLAEKLKGEWPGALAWMLDGCRAWQVEGLNPPAAVLEATQEYLASEDALATWMAECCTTAVNDFTLVKALFESWAGWCDGGNEKAGSRKAFSQRLMDAGFEPYRQGDGRGFNGIGLRPSKEPL